MLFIIVNALPMLIHLILLMILFGRNRITFLTIIRKDRMPSNIYTNVCFHITYLLM